MKRIEGIILCSSCFLKHGGRAMKTVKRMLDAYESVKPNLDRHAPGCPSAETLRQCVHLGISAFGEALWNGFGEEKNSCSKNESDLKAAIVSASFGCTKVNPRLCRGGEKRFGGQQRNRKNPSIEQKWFADHTSTVERDSN